jgi:hypothetical protein
MPKKGHNLKKKAMCALLAIHEHRSHSSPTIRNTQLVLLPCCVANLYKFVVNNNNLQRKRENTPCVLFTHDMHLCFMMTFNVISSLYVILWFYQLELNKCGGKHISFLHYDLFFCANLVTTWFCSIGYLPLVLEVIEFPGSSLTVALSSQENGTFVRSALYAQPSPDSKRLKLVLESKYCMQRSQGEGIRL